MAVLTHVETPDGVVHVDSRGGIGRGSLRTVCGLEIKAWTYRGKPYYSGRRLSRPHDRPDELPALLAGETTCMVCLVGPACED